LGQEGEEGGWIPNTLSVLARGFVSPKREGRKCQHPTLTQENRKTQSNERKKKLCNESERSVMQGYSQESLKKQRGPIQCFPKSKWRHFIKGGKAKERLVQSDSPRNPAVSKRTLNAGKGGGVRQPVPCSGSAN